MEVSRLSITCTSNNFNLEIFNITCKIYLQRNGPRIYEVETIQTRKGRNFLTQVWTSIDSQRGILDLHEHEGLFECHYRIAGFPRGELYPSVTRLGFFVPDKRNVLVPENEVPNQEEIRKQIEDTPYWKWFERNTYEFQIHEKYKDELKMTSRDKESILQTIRKVNKELGYDMYKLGKKSRTIYSNFINF